MVNQKSSLASFFGVDKSVADFFKLNLQVIFLIGLVNTSFFGGGHQ